MKNLNLYLGLLFLFIFSSCQDTSIPTYEQWHLIQLDFDGATFDTEENPFTDYRLEATFTKDDKQYKVPGFLAQENPAVWRVNFSADEVGLWNYNISFRKGEKIAVSTTANEGEGLFFDGTSGQFAVIPTTKTGRDFRAKGRIVKEGKYLKHLGSGDYFFKVGPDSPENFLAYDGFSNTYSIDSTKQFVKSYKAHEQDWEEDENTWINTKGKGITGMINYISDKGMNVIYMLTNNIKGDGEDVFPYKSPDDFTQFDCKKLAEWDIIFSHAQKKGVMMHFVTQETENELLLDGGNTDFERKLYYRELVARFGYHNGVMWNLGEENGYAEFTPEAQNDQQRKDMITWFDENDPYNHPLVIHTHSWESARSPIIAPLLGIKALDGLSFQQGERHLVHQRFTEWFAKSKAAGHEWMINMDEIGIYHTGAVPDSFDMEHDSLRKEVLWGSLMAGASGVEWYFGYKFPHADLNCEDWRTRDNLWTQTNYAKLFFEQIPNLNNFEGHDELIAKGVGYCYANIGKTYLIYLKNGGTTTLDLGADNTNTYTIKWYNPRKGGDLQNGSIEHIKGIDQQGIGTPPNDMEKDWAVLISAIED